MRDASRSEVAGRLRAALTAASTRDGAWPYTIGKRARLEPTCWALLALHEDEAVDRDSRRQVLAAALRWLEATQRGDGLLIDVDGGPPNFTANGVAACVLAHVLAADPVEATSAGAPDLGRLVGALIRVKGVSVDAPDPRQNNKLQGWPWMPDTFSWLEPTCWCVLALKKAGARSAGEAARVQEAEALILNRTCEAGGWNFGNASVIGQDLRPYVPTTALALLALQNHGSTPEVERSTRWLRESRLKEPSAIALALTAIWLHTSGAPTDDVIERLADDVDRAEARGNLQALAMMLYALTLTTHDARAFRV